MADNQGNKVAKDYHLDVKPAQEGFYLKGLNHCDWGMKTGFPHLQPQVGNTVMLPLTTATSWPHRRFGAH